jgi:1-acyl-sn-glycerol-3-phosphate acyltransferase
VERRNSQKNLKYSSFFDRLLQGEEETMFFRFMRGVVRVVFFIINGNAHYQNKEKLPKDENYILVAPHRTWWEPLYLAVAAAPKQFSFMAKEELFKNPVLSYILKHANAFPVNRDKPGPSAIKTPVKLLKSTELSLIMFPSGTRHSSELKGGMALIAKMSKTKIVPSVYQGPLTLGDLFKRKRVVVRFGDPIDISDIKKMDKEGLAEVERRTQEAFDQLDKEVDPNFVYDAKK